MRFESLQRSTAASARWKSTSPTACTACCKATFAACSPGRAPSPTTGGRTRSATTFAGSIGACRHAANEIHVRDTIADREVETWVVIDGSASLDFGTDQWQKRDLAVAATAAFGFMSCIGGSRFGAIVTDPNGIVVHQAAAGRDHVRRVLRTLHQRPPAISGVTDLAGAIERIDRLGRRPGVVVLISDLLGDTAWVRPLRAHRHRCSTLIAELRDRREDELPNVGLLTVVDPETGSLRDVPTSNPKFRARFAAAAAERRAQSAQAARLSGADHLVLNTDRDWLTDLVHHHLNNRRMR